MIVGREVENIGRPAADIVVTDAGERERAARLAACWMRNAGLHFDFEGGVVDELFGERGRLHMWRDDDLLRHEMLALWRQVRPIGQQIDREEIERAEEWKAARARRATVEGYSHPTTSRTCCSTVLGLVERPAP